MEEAVFSRDGLNLCLGLVEEVFAVHAPSAAALRIRRLGPTRKQLMRVHTVKGSFPKPGADEVCVIESQESSVGRENRIDNKVRFCRRDFTRLRAVNFRDEQVVAGGVG